MMTKQEMHDEFWLLTKSVLQDSRIDTEEARVLKRWLEEHQRETEFGIGYSQPCYSIVIFLFKLFEIDRAYVFLIGRTIAVEKVIVIIHRHIRGNIHNLVPKVFVALFGFADLI